jgi:Tfp pilus assembly protein PilV
MKPFLLFVITILCTLVLMAQNQIQLAVSDAQRAQYWRALYEITAAEADPLAQKKATTVIGAFAQARAEKASVKLIASVVEITRACNLTELTMYFDGAGEPACPPASALPVYHREK